MIPKQCARVNTQYDEINRKIDTAWDKGCLQISLLTHFQLVFHLYTSLKTSENRRFPLPTLKKFVFEIFTLFIQTK